MDIKGFINSKVDMTIGRVEKIGNTKDISTRMLPAYGGYHGQVHTCMVHTR